MKMHKLKEACKQEIQRCFREAAVRYPKYADRLRGVPIKWSSRMTHTAGKAQPAYSDYSFRVRIGEYIKLSLPLLETERENFVKRTPGHEAAHIIAWIVFGARGHGWQWRMVARELGIADTRCHRYKTPARKRK